MKKRTAIRHTVMGLALLTALAAAPGREALAAQKEGPVKTDLLAALDLDKNGRISEAEFNGPQGLFARLDANRDGVLDQDEQGRLAAAAPNRPGPRGRSPFHGFDRDGDGKLSREEFPGPDDHFARFDSDRDGYLSQDEMPRRPDGPGGTGPDRRSGPGPGGPGGSLFGPDGFDLAGLGDDGFGPGGFGPEGFLDDGFGPDGFGLDGFGPDGFGSNGPGPEGQGQGDPGV